MAVFPPLLRPTERPVRQRSGLAATEEWRPGRRLAVTQDKGNRPRDRAEWTTVSRYGHLRSAPVLVDAVLHTEREPPTLRASLSDSTRRGFLPLQRRTNVSEVSPRFVDAVVDQVFVDVLLFVQVQNFAKIADYSLAPALAGCRRHCVTLSRWTGSQAVRQHSAPSRVAD